jgi:exopolysaccharide biosynthesis polyprenyl glycosylphosphotransferase
VLTKATRIAHSPPIGKRANPRRLYAQLGVFVAATDVLMMVAAVLLARWIRYGHHAPQQFHMILLMVLAPTIELAVFAGFRLYSLPRLSPADEFRRIILALSISISLIPLIAFWSKESYSRVWIGLTWAFALLFTLSSRRVWHWAMGRARARGDLLFRTVIVGGNNEAGSLIDMMRTPRLGFRVIGLVTTEDHDEPDAGNAGVPHLGTLDDLERILAETDAECVFVASSAVTQRDMARLTRAIRDSDVQVRMSSSVTDILSTRLMIQQVGNMTTLALRPVRLSGAQAAAKRTLDLGLSLGVLVLTLPVWLIIALMIKVDSRGPILYQQRRVGRHEKPFMMLKFRTMVNRADQLLDHLIEQNEASGPLFKLRADPRITRMGRWLRRWSLDELPQLVNVLKGEMSLVGPRPPLPDEVAQYDVWQLDRLSVPPGITGLWQVRGRSHLSFDDYVRLDLYYIENWSVAFDLYILAKTIPAVLSHKGAF